METHTKTTRETRSFVFRTAWAAFRAGIGSFADALRHAWRAAKLKTRMLAGEAEFAYRKVDGTARRAFGTLCGPFARAKGTGRPASDKVLAYYDLESDGWRSCRIEALLF